jgi:hypothetical protein
MTAQVIDFARAVRARKVASIEDNRARQIEEVKRYLEEGRKRLRAEALALAGPFKNAALLAADRVTEFDPGHPYGSCLGYFNACRRYDVSTGMIDGELVSEFETYEDWCRRALVALRFAIAELDKAKREPGQRRVVARRRLLSKAKRDLLDVLFRFGRRRIDHRELEWRTDFDGLWTYTRRREPRTLG